MPNVVVHLHECEPEKHPTWVKRAYINAANDGGVLCERTAYMNGELFPEEPVWVEQPSVGAEAGA